MSGEPGPHAATWLFSSFSLNMLPRCATCTIRVETVSLAEAREAGQTARSAVGHADTAAQFAELLRRPVAVDRRTVSLEPGETALVGQYVGPRLEAGATTRPRDAEVRWTLVTVLADSRSPD